MWHHWIEHTVIVPNFTFFVLIRFCVRGAKLRSFYSAFVTAVHH